MRLLHQFFPAFLVLSHDSCDVQYQHVYIRYVSSVYRQYIISISTETIGHTYNHMIFSGWAMVWAMRPLHPNLFFWNKEERTSTWKIRTNWITNSSKNGNNEMVKKWISLKNMRSEWENEFLMRKMLFNEKGENENEKNDWFIIGIRQFIKGALCHARWEGTRSHAVGRRTYAGRNA